VTSIGVRISLHHDSGIEPKVVCIAVRLTDAEMAAMDTSPDGLSVARTSLNSCATTTRGTGRRKRVRAKSNGA